MEQHDLSKALELDHPMVCDLRMNCHSIEVLVNELITNEFGSGTILKFHEMLAGASPMHLTKSVDYAVVMEGEIEMHLDDGSCTVLRQGLSTRL